VGLIRSTSQRATRSKVIVTHTPAYCVDELADHARAHAVARNIVRFMPCERARGYTPARPIRRLRGRTLGLLGFYVPGARARAARASARAEVIAADPAVNDALRCSWRRASSCRAAGARMCSASTRRLSRRRRVDRARGARGPQTGPRQHVAWRPHRPGSLADALESVSTVSMSCRRSRPLPATARPRCRAHPHAGFLSVESLESVKPRRPTRSSAPPRGELPLHVVNLGGPRLGA
jgi:hypothetical protein